MPGKPSVATGKRPEHVLSLADRQPSPLRARLGHTVRGKGLPEVLAKSTGQVIPPQEKYSIQIFTAIMLSVGFGCGLGLKPDTSMPEPWNSIGEVAGWMYFAAWSLSFYPQLYSNWRRKSVVGYSFDFALTNVLGFACLAIYYCAFYFDSSIRKQYRTVHHGADNAVRVNDVFFALHGALLTLLTLTQIGIYERGSQRVSPVCRWAVACAMLVVIVYAGLLAILPKVFSAIAFLYLLSYIKVAVTASKYVPQAILNYRRKSTDGFNIGQMILDFTGGVLSFFQLVLEAIVLKDSSLITGDPVKLFLSVLSIFYDSVLMFQHYVLYADARKKAESPAAPETDAEALLPESTAQTIV